MEFVYPKLKPSSKSAFKGNGEQCTSKNASLKADKSYFFDPFLRQHIMTFRRSLPLMFAETIDEKRMEKFLLSSRCFVDAFRPHPSTFVDLYSPENRKLQHSKRYSALFPVSARIKNSVFLYFAYIRLTPAKKKAAKLTFDFVFLFDGINMELHRIKYILSFHS